MMAGQTSNGRVFSEHDDMPLHLTTDPNHRKGQGFDANPDRGEFYCMECRRRITRNSEHGREYGHDLQCDHHEVSGIEPINTGHFADGGAP